MEARSVWARHEKDWIDCANCEGKDQKLRVFLVEPTLLKTSKMTQTSPPTSPGSKEDQGAGAQEPGEAPPEGKVSCAVDTSDLEEALQGLMTPRPYKEDLEGRKEVELEGEEGGLGDNSEQG